VTEQLSAANCELFAKLFHLDSCLKYKSSANDNLGLIWDTPTNFMPKMYYDVILLFMRIKGHVLDTPIFNTLKIYRLFIQCPKNEQEDNQSRILY